MVVLTSSIFVIIIVSKIIAWNVLFELELFTQFSFDLQVQTPKESTFGAMVGASQTNLPVTGTITNTKLPRHNSVDGENVLDVIGCDVIMDAMDRTAHHLKEEPVASCILAAWSNKRKAPVFSSKS